MFNLILSAEGTLGNPGIVIIDPQITTTNSAPLDNLTSLTFKLCPIGAPFNLGSTEKLYCVLAIQIGKFEYPAFSILSS